ncbi:hypothetical protein [Hydrogenibacillus schlegelii]|uniref:hypothetical protein n=1 Tax=Hydrogenibacillus schlegelii TaxID=1484 RepID=UPI0023564AEC|nr:hypothetical protein [Hydrogenibacillus schlegelii]
MRLRTLEDVRKVLERRHGKIPDVVWEEFEGMEIPQVALGNEGDLEYVEERLVRLLNVYKAGQGRKVPTSRAPKEETLPPDERLLALSEVLSIRAARRPDVQAFRHEVLGGHLIRPEDIPAWIKERHAQDGEHRVFLTVTVVVPAENLPGLPAVDASAQDLLTAAQQAVAVCRPVSFKEELKLLYFPNGANDAFETVPISYGGVLWRLKKIAESLEQEYGWHEAQTVSFVLSGTVPFLSRGMVGYRWRKIGPRITLELDPRLSRTEVARIYSRWRGRLFQGADKPIERKAARLAVFAEEYRDSGLSWRELMAVWNRQYPEWPYHTAVHFARDCQLAWQRVTGEKWPRKKEGKRRGKEAGTR